MVRYSIIAMISSHIIQTPPSPLQDGTRSCSCQKYRRKKSGGILLCAIRWCIDKWKTDLWFSDYFREFGSFVIQEVFSPLKGCVGGVIKFIFNPIYCQRAGVLRQNYSLWLESVSTTVRRYARLLKRGIKLANLVIQRTAAVFYSSVEAGKQIVE